MFASASVLRSTSAAARHSATICAQLGAGLGLGWPPLCATGSEISICLGCGRAVCRLLTRQQPVLHRTLISGKWIYLHQFILWGREGISTPECKTLCKTKLHLEEAPALGLIEMPGLEACQRSDSVWGMDMPRSQSHHLEDQTSQSSDKPIHNLVSRDVSPGSFRC